MVGGLTGNFHHSVFGLHHQLLRWEVVHVQGHLPGFWGLLDLWHSTTHLAGQCTGLLGHRGSWVHPVGHHEACIRGQDGRPYVSWPVGAGECAEFLRQGWHTEGLVEDSAVLVPVAEWIPAGGPDQSEGDMSLSHDCCVQAAQEHVRVWSAVHRLAESFYAPPLSAESSHLPQSPQLTPFTCLWNRLEFLLVAMVAHWWNPGPPQSQLPSTGQEISPSSPLLSPPTRRIQKAVGRSLSKSFYEDFSGKDWSAAVKDCQSKYQTSCSSLSESGTFIPKLSKISY